MKLKVKFFLFAASVGVALLAVSCAGYFYAKSEVKKNIEAEMYSVVGAHSKELNGWLLTKAQTAVTTSETIRRVLGDADMPVTFVQSYAADPSLLNLYAGFEDGKFLDGAQSNLPADFDARKRGWYQQAKEKNRLIFTDAYIDTSTNKYVVSAATPIKGASGNMRGVVAIDISLDLLSEQVKQINLNGKGYGFIIDQKGVILAHPDPQMVSQNISDFQAFKTFFKDILNKDTGTITYQRDGITELMIYKKIASTGWLLAISVNQEEVYQQINTLRYQFITITLLGLLVVGAASWMYARRLTGQIVALTYHAESLAAGDLTIQELTFKSKDEVGQLATAFNRMVYNLRNLIARVSQTAEQVAASSEELSASAEQSAQATNQVAVTINQVAQGTDTQASAIKDTAAVIEQMATNIKQMAVNTSTLAEMSERTASAAIQGNEAVEAAMNQMGNIENTVTSSAQVVTNLGERSKEIGQIVGTISEIAGQTNLLALNAAIEAARAGEQGRGFAVVADEVRKLAEQSQAAAKQIASLITAIQSETDRAVAAMNEGSREVKTGAEVVNNAGYAFKNIASLIGEVSTQTKEISAAIQQMTAGSQQIVASVQDIERISQNTACQTQTVSAATEEQSAAMQEIAESSQSLASMAEELQSAVKQFKV